ncbi:baseplate J/gp47 family protein [Microvirgula aerodenitrificans]|uniref:baseplate J/gp47 family protein n=1 Tax=Microvirgula aerodenitrificans TaxID=57480 RepID=UPI00248E2A33|nr:baseplate J/gp47 family protein [Microvirgula aerodenitrificans]
MPFTVPAFASIRDALLRDIKNQLPDADTGADSDYFIRATSVASAVEGLYQHQSWIVRQIFPDTADREYLELHARVRGLSRKPAVAAQGLTRATGTPGATLPVGQIFRVNGMDYRSVTEARFEAKSVAFFRAQAVVPGVAGNLPLTSKGELIAAPPGVASGILAMSIAGGVDEESDSELLARLLELIRRPPAGGNKYDYRRWAMEVAGVSAAYVYPLRRGLGTVDVVITAGGALPSDATLAAVQAHIDDLRPVTARNSLVLAPTPKTIDIDIRVSLSGLTLPAAQAQIQTALAGYFNQLSPGDSVIRSRIEALVSDLPGVVDRAIVQPTANVVPLVDAGKVEWVRLGNVTVGAL